MDQRSPSSRTDRPDGLHDPSEPVACTLGIAEVPARLAEIESLVDRATAIERTDHGVVVRLPDEGPNAADVRRFVAAEKDCCPFWGFDVAVDGSEIVVRWDGPPEMAAFMDRLSHR